MIRYLHLGFFLAIEFTVFCRNFKFKHQKSCILLILVKNIHFWKTETPFEFKKYLKNFHAFTLLKKFISTSLIDFLCLDDTYYASQKWQNANSKFFFGPLWQNVFQNNSEYSLKIGKRRVLRNEYTKTPFLWIEPMQKNRA